MSAREPNIALGAFYNSTRAQRSFAFSAGALLPPPPRRVLYIMYMYECSSQKICIHVYTQGNWNVSVLLSNEPRARKKFRINR
jgi:hypothetical protein